MTDTLRDIPLFQLVNLFYIIKIFKAVGGRAFITWSIMAKKLVAFLFGFFRQHIRYSPVPLFNGKLLIHGEQRFREVVKQFFYLALLIKSFLSAPLQQHISGLLLLPGQIDFAQERHFPGNIKQGDDAQLVIGGYLQSDENIAPVLFLYDGGFLLDSKGIDLQQTLFARLGPAE
jgi:hypothetical protein